MAAADRIARAVTVHGRVQGVYFRQSTRQAAQEAGVSGWIRNQSDGTVRALLEGSPEAVERVVAFLHRGPQRARVDQVDIDDAELEGRTSFEVR
jgi:acylphosphatase